jgi:saccharopine dehydrogenase-like NADP-dependent oxidoreductase
VRILILGAGGVGTAAALMAAHRDFPSHVVVADRDLSRAEKAVAGPGDSRFVPARLDAGDQAAIEALLRDHRIDVVLGATDPRFTMPIFLAALSCQVHYLDMAMSLSRPHPSDPYNQTGVKLGDEQFAWSQAWEASGRLALLGMGVEPGLADVFGRYAADNLFREIDEAGVRDGANLVIEGYDFAPSFNIWTTIEECLNPPVVYETDRGWFTTEPFSEPEIFDFPEGIGPVQCVNVEHEEVLLIPRWLEVKRVTFKYGLGAEFIDILKTLRRLGLDRTEMVRVGAIEVSPRDVVAACLPDPATLGARMTGKTCAGLWVRGTGKDGRPRSTYLYHVVDNDWSVRQYGSQAVVWQTAINPIIAMELIDNGSWTGSGVFGPEAFEAEPFLDLLAGPYGSPWGQVELSG